MPTYTLYSAAGRLTGQHRRTLAAQITTAHAECTGAPAAFVQCIFSEVDPSRRYIGGAPASAQSIWVLAHLRGGRPRAVKDHLIGEVIRVVADTLNIPPVVVWVYLVEIDHLDMAEFGRQLPEAGAEAEWLDQLPAESRQLVAGLDVPAWRGYPHGG